MKILIKPFSGRYQTLSARAFELAASMNPYHVGSPAAMDQYLRRLNYDPDNTYFMCPLYRVDGKIDYQIQVTGGAEGDETPEQAINRELSEEVGLSYNSFYSLTRSDSYTVFALNLAGTRFNTVAEVQPPRALAHHKVAAYIFGDRNQVGRYALADIIRPHMGQETECLYAVALVPWTFIWNKLTRPRACDDFTLTED